MLDFLKQHDFWTATVLYWILSAAVSSLPQPSVNSGAGYSWLFRFVHTIAGNLTTAFGSRIPGVKALVLLSILPLLFSTTACGAHYTVHPGALNVTDSTAYDALLVAESAIDQARLKIQAGSLVLPDPARKAFDALVRTYNLARESWLTYRGVLGTRCSGTGLPGSTQQEPCRSDGGANAIRGGQMSDLIFQILELTVFLAKNHAAGRVNRVQQSRILCFRSFARPARLTCNTPGRLWIRRLSRLRLLLTLNRERSKSVPYSCPPRYYLTRNQALICFYKI